MRRFFTIPCLVVLEACGPSSTPTVHPTCPPPPNPVEPAGASSAPVPTSDSHPASRSPPADENPGPTLETLGSVGYLDAAPPKVITSLATVWIEPYEQPGAEGDPVLHVRVHVQGPDGATMKLERASSLDLCAEAYPGIQVVGGDEETLTIDARIVCRMGETIVHEVVDHTIVRIALEGTGLQSKIVFTGRSMTRDNRGLAVETDRLEFYLEAGKLGIYRHRSAWCDRAGLRTLMGSDFDGCSTRKRTLEFVERI